MKKIVFALTWYCIFSVVSISHASRLVYGDKAGRDPKIPNLTHEGGTMIEFDDAGFYRRFESGGGTDEYSGPISFSATISQRKSMIEIEVDNLKAVNIRAKILRDTVKGYIGKPGEPFVPVYGKGEWKYISGNVDGSVMKYIVTYIEKKKGEKNINFSEVSPKVDATTGDIYVTFSSPSEDIGAESITIIYSPFNDFLDGSIEGNANAILGKKLKKKLKKKW